MAVRRTLSLVVGALTFVLFACTVPTLPPPPTSTTTYTTTQANWGQVALMREYFFANGECWRPTAVRWQLHNGALMGAPITGTAEVDADLHPNPTIHIESWHLEWDGAQPTFSPLTLADGEGAFTEWVNPPEWKAMLMSVTYTIVDTGEVVTKTEVLGLGCAVGG